MVNVGKFIILFCLSSRISLYAFLKKIFYDLKNKRYLVKAINHFLGGS